jgi:hypothetical protein
MQDNKTRSGTINSVAIDSEVGIWPSSALQPLEPNHFPVRFAGMEPTRHLTEQAPANVRRNCTRPMRFIKSIRPGPSQHELRVFLCPHCAEADLRRVDRQPRSAPTGQGPGEPDHQGIRQ